MPWGIPWSDQEQRIDVESTLAQMRSVLGVAGCEGTIVVCVFFRRAKRRVLPPFCGPLTRKLMVFASMAGARSRNRRS